MDRSWLDEALCAQVGVDIFYPRDYHREDSTEALQTCAQCPVIAQCLEDAARFETAPDKIWGVWGGLSRLERQRQFRQARRRNQKLVYRLEA